ncbi:MAG TPA: hypothetical protein PLK04_05270 [Bacillota bacterium]|nr:hypothetical protein [Bacillota bacterium]HOB42070.1 hypothetical protein [Bacillota bacterium]HOK71126.1 hypothetical protein [Bacillota bacterium]HPZ13628.1 hypothetical protein [Bacillota bacterium]
MRIPTDPDSIGLIKAMRPFLSERGQAAVDDVLGSVNLVGIYTSVSDVLTKRRGMGHDRPLAFLSSLANMELDPKIVSKAVDSMMEMSKKPESEPERATSPKGPSGPSADDVAKMLQNVMDKASSDPNFAALLGSLAEEGMRSNMLPKLLESLGPEFLPPQDQPEQ